MTPPPDRSKEVNYTNFWTRATTRFPELVRVYGKELPRDETGNFRKDALVHAYRLLTPEAYNEQGQFIGAPKPVAPVAPVAPTPPPAFPVTPADTQEDEKPGKFFGLPPIIDPKGRSYLERILGMEKPPAIRQAITETVMGVPRFLGAGSAAGVATAWDALRGGPSPEQESARQELMAQLAASQAPDGDRSLLDRMKQKTEALNIRARDLHPFARFAAEAAPIILADIALTKGRGFTSLADRLRGPAGGLVKQPGIGGVIKRGTAEVVSPMVGEEQMFNVAFHGAGRVAAPVARAVTGIPKFPFPDIPLPPLHRRVPKPSRLPLDMDKDIPFTPSAGPDPTRQGIRIGDDVVFVGEDGAPISGKVTGEGTIEINEVSRPYVDIKTATGETVRKPLDMDEVRLADVPLTPTRGSWEVPRTVQRIEEPGVVTSFDKPQGLYTSPVDVVSPHLDLGGKRSTYDIDPNANILSIDTTDFVTTNRGRSVGQAAGVGALRNLVGEAEATRILALSKQAAIEEMTQKYPNVQWGKYFDTQEIAEGYAGNIARERGYDAIWAIDQKAPDFNEFVVLNKKIATPTQAADVPLTPKDAPGIPPLVSEMVGEAPVIGPLPDFNEQAKIINTPDIWKRLSRLPIMRYGMRKFNPSALVRDPLDVAEATVNVQRENANTLTSVALARLSRLGLQREVFGELDDKGLIKEGPFKGMAVNTLRSNPGKYQNKFTPKQKEWVDTARTLEKANLERLQNAGIDIKELTFEEGGEYAGRRVFALVDSAGEIMSYGSVGSEAKKFGAKLPQQKHRIFKTPEEAIAAGYRYLPEDETLYLNIQGGYEKIIQKDFMDWVLLRTDVIPTKTPEALDAVLKIDKKNIARARSSVRDIQDALRGKTLARGTVKKIEDLWPFFQGRLSRPTQVRIADVLRAAKELSKPEEAFDPPKAGVIINLRKAVDKLKEKIKLDPNNPVLQKELSDKNKSLGFAKLRYKVFAETGKPMTVPRNVIKELKKEFNDDLNEILTTMRGRKVLRPGVKTPKYEGGLIGELEQKKIATEKLIKEAKRVPSYTKAEVRGFPGLLFDKDTGKRLNDIVNIELAPAGMKANINKIQAVQRFFMLGGDISPMGIQLLFLAGYKPLVWGKAMKGFVKAFLDPKWINKYLDENRAWAMKYPGLFLSGGGTKKSTYEFTEAIGRSGAPDFRVKGAISPQALAKEGISRSIGILGFRRFARGFEGSMDVAGIELAKSLDYLGTSPARINDLAQFINKFRGVTSSARLGVSPSQRQNETLVALAPMYTRAITALLFDVFHGGLSGELARKSLAQGVAALMAMGIVISKAKGESDEEIYKHFIPGNPEFFTWDIGGQNIGPGSKVRTIVNLVGKSVDSPEDLWKLPWKDLEYMKNPIIRFGRGLASPLVSGSWDLLTGKDFIGDPTREGKLQMTETVAKNFVPIWLQSTLFEDGVDLRKDLPKRLSRGATEFVGGRAYPLSPWERAQVRGEELLSGMDMGKTYEEIKNARGYGQGTEWDKEDMSGSPTNISQLDPGTQITLQKDPEYARIQKESIEGTRSPIYSELYSKLNLLKVEVKQKLINAWEASEKADPEHVGQAYKKARKNIFSKYYTRRKVIYENAKDKGAFADRDIETPFEKAEDVYNKLLYADDKDLFKKLITNVTGRPYRPLEDVFGQDNWYERNLREEYLRKAYSPKFVEDMKALSLEKADWPGAELEYRIDMDYIREQGYWDLDIKLAKEADQRLIAAGLIQTNLVEQLLNKYEELKSNARIAEAREFLESARVLKKVVFNKVTKERKLMRARDPELERLIMKYYDYKPVEVPRFSLVTN